MLERRKRGRDPRGGSGEVGKGKKNEGKCPFYKGRNSSSATRRGPKDTAGPSMRMVNQPIMQSSGQLSQCKGPGTVPSRWQNLGREIQIVGHKGAGPVPLCPNLKTIPLIPKLAGTRVLGECF